MGVQIGSKGSLRDPKGTRRGGKRHPKEPQREPKGTSAGPDSNMLTCRMPRASMPRCQHSNMPTCQHANVLTCCMSTLVSTPVRGVTWYIFFKKQKKKEKILKT